jgi:hypothetical protein
MQSSVCASTTATALYAGIMAASAPPPNVSSGWVDSQPKYVATNDSEVVFFVMRSFCLPDAGLSFSVAQHERSFLSLPCVST